MKRKDWTKRLKNIVRQRTIATRSAVMSGRASARLVELEQRRVSSRDRTPVSTVNTNNPNIEINSAPAGINRIGGPMQESGSPSRVPSRPHTPNNLSPQTFQSQETPLGESVHHQLIGVQTNTLTTALDDIEDEISEFEAIADRERNWTHLFKDEYKSLNKKLEAKKLLCKQQGLKIVLTRIYTLSARLTTHFQVLQRRSKHCSTTHANVSMPQATGGSNEATENSTAASNTEGIDDAPLDGSSAVHERVSVQAMVHRINSASNSPTARPASRSGGRIIQEIAQVDQGNDVTNRPIVSGERVDSAADFEILDHASNSNDNGDDNDDDALSTSGPPPYQVFDLNYLVRNLTKSLHFKSEVCNLVANVTDPKFEQYKSLIDDCDESIKTLEELRIKNRTVNSIQEDLARATTNITKLLRESSSQKKSSQDSSILVNGLISDLGKLEEEFNTFKAAAARDKQTLSAEVANLSRQVKNLDSYIRSHRCVDYQDRSRNPDNIGVRFSQDSRNRTDEQPRSPVQIQTHRVRVSQSGAGLPLLAGRDASSGRRQDTSPIRHMSPQHSGAELSFSGWCGQSRQEADRRCRSISPNPNTSFSSPPVGRSSRQSSRSATSNIDGRAKERLEIRITQCDDELNRIMSNNPTESCISKEQIMQLKNTAKPSVEELRGELVKLNEKYEQLPNPSYEILQATDSTLTTAREWLVSFRERFQNLDGFSNPLSGKSILDVGLFTEQSDISIFEFIRKFEFAQCSGQGTKSERATLLFEKHLDGPIKDKFFDLRDNYDSLVSSLKQTYGLPTMMCKNIMKSISGDPPGINSSIFIIADYMRILECACKKLDSLFQTPGIDRSTLRDEAYGNVFIKNLIDKVPDQKLDEVYDLIEGANGNISYLHGEVTYNVIRQWIKSYARKTDAKARNSSSSTSTTVTKTRTKANQGSTNVTVAGTNDRPSREKRDQARNGSKGPGSGAIPDKSRNQNQNKSREQEKGKKEQDLSKLCPIREKDHRKDPHSVLSCKEFLEASPLQKRRWAWGKLCFTCLGEYKKCKPNCIGNAPDDMLCHDCGRAHPDERSPNFIMCPDVTHRERWCVEDCFRALASYFPTLEFDLNEPSMLGLL